MIKPYFGSFKESLTGQDLVNAIRLDIIKEQDAIITYEVHLKSTTDTKVKRILNEIIMDEKMHLYHLNSLLKYLDGGREFEAEAEAIEEFLEMEGGSD